MSMASRIRRVTARVARLFAILSSINLLVCAIAMVQALSRIGGTVKESRHDDRRGEHVRSDYLRREASVGDDGALPSPAIRNEVPVLTPDRPWDASPVGIC